MRPYDPYDICPDVECAINHVSHWHEEDGIPRCTAWNGEECTYDEDDWFQCSSEQVEQ